MTQTHAHAEMAKHFQVNATCSHKSEATAPGSGQRLQADTETGKRTNRWTEKVTPALPLRSDLRLRGCSPT